MKADLTNQTFGRLRVISEAESKTSPCGDIRRYWNCLCSCGKTKAIGQGHLKGGKIISCGCSLAESASKRATARNYRHGMSKHPVHAVWFSMLQRCSNPNKKCYPLYGGRGITVCQKWMDFESFIEDMGIPEKGMTLDRIDTNGNYEPGNCRWATMKTQQNNRRNNHMVTIDGVTRTIAQWAELYGLRHDTLSWRIAAGKTGRKLLTPV